ncbi:hypothetical protein WOLCODRAFT_139001 [Wolfiporia cocos MD-104 SS10]|uniref:Smr domain-containing protein n=1 Tax=Wolfiporia cocos (strain MD-104) TaxID=742152 RepID=A0A2H3K5U5_WOLCO|nr:hypothetical protein WOLCODRAFT_139001 [Wolfiporia cocos MD-104 SS10]
MPNMGSASQTSVLDTLQAEFSPPLDGPLIAAIVADYVSEGMNNASDNIQALRDVLGQLASQAEKELMDEDTLSEQFSHTHISPYSITDETSSLHDLSVDTSNTAYSSTSSGSCSQHSFSSPLGFLQAAFPHLSTSRLKRALSLVEDASDLDMESVVEGLLSSEYVRELEERGLDGLDDVEGSAKHDADWLTVDAKKRATTKSAKKSKKWATTITIVDIRQKQHERPIEPPRSSAPDPWTQLSSVASYLATIVSTRSPSYFLSFFHSPEHSTPAKALRAALRSLSTSSHHDEEEIPSDETAMLFNMFDVLRATPAFADLDAEERDQLMADAHLALRATCGQPDEAIDIVWLLRDLDSDFKSGVLEWGVYHAHAPSRRARVNLPTGPPPVQPPPPPVRSLAPPDRPRSKQPLQNAWTTVPQRQRQGPHPLAESIPAYRRKVRSGGNGLGKGGKGDVGELATHKMRVNELMAQRHEALREAGRAWQRGGSKARGGEVAFYYAERARELQQQARIEQLDAAREMVQAKRATSANGDTVDLHGTTTAEAVQIVKDILRESGSSPAKPLRIITGRGTHSANGISVLGPAVRSALLEDGWTVGSFEGGLVVRGKSAWRT